MLPPAIRRRLRALRGARHYLGKLARTTPGERAAMVTAQGALAWAQLLVWTLPEGRLVDSSGSTDAPEGTSPSAEQEARAQRIALAINRAAEFGLFRPKCLVRSVALHRLLERGGLTGSQIRVGVRLQNGRFDAHAWVVYGGAIIGDREHHVGQYAPLPSARVRARG